MYNSSQLTPESLVAALPAPDIFVRTSGVRRLSDLQLFELSTHATYISESGLTINTFSKLQMYKLLTQWQFFRMDRQKVEHYNIERYMPRSHAKKPVPLDELDRLREEFHSDQSDSASYSRVYFMNEQ